MKRLLITIAVVKFLISIPILICAMAITVFLFREIGWDKPFNWLCVSYLVLVIVEIVLKKREEPC